MVKNYIYIINKSIINRICFIRILFFIILFGISSLLFGISSLLFGISSFGFYVYTPTETVLFELGDYGRECCRLPAIVRCPNGRIFAFAEGRQYETGCNDVGPIDIVYKISLNNGETWEDYCYIIAGGNNNNYYHNPVPVVNQNGRVYIFYCQDQEKIYYRSRDCYSYGFTPAEEAPLPLDFGDGLHAGPGHGIMLTKGSLAGTLVVAFQYRENSHSWKRIRVLYSQDHGSHWNVSAKALGNPPRSGFNISEVCIAELDNGDLYFNIRNEGDDLYRIHAEVDPDEFLFGSSGVIYDLQLDHYLPDPKCHASVLKFDQELTLFANLAMQTVGHDYRRFLTIRRSYNDTGDWSETKLLTGLPSGYSDMVKLDGTYLGILYEKGDEGGRFRDKIVFSKIHKNWLTDSTVASWEFCEHAPGTWITRGEKIRNWACSGGLDGSIPSGGWLKYGNGPNSASKSLYFGYNTRSYIYIPDGDANNVFDFDEGETFQISCHIRTTYHKTGGISGSGALVAKDNGPGNKQWWLRIIDGQVQFWVKDEEKSSYARTDNDPDDLCNGEWHYIVAIRSGYLHNLRIMIDGVERANEPDTTTGDFRNSRNVTIGNFACTIRQFKGWIAQPRIKFFK